MSRRAMLILILAILAVHGVLLWILVATDSNERQIAETRRQIEEENALHSGMDGGEPLPAIEQTEPDRKALREKYGINERKEAGSDG